MRVLAMVVLGTGVAHADTLDVAVGVRAGSIDAGGDHGSWSGGALQVEHTLSPHVALRGEVDLEHVTVSSDEAVYSTDELELATTVGLRFDVIRRDDSSGLRLYYAAAVGADWWTHGSSRVEPFAVGLDLEFLRHDYLRAEASVALFNTSAEQVLSIGFAALLVHHFD